MLIIDSATTAYDSLTNLLSAVLEKSSDSLTLGGDFGVRITQPLDTWDFQTVVLAVSPFLSLFGVIITAIIFHISQKRALEAAEKRHTKQFEATLDRMEKEFHYKDIEQELAIAKAILPECVKALQAAFSHAMTLNTLLNQVSTAIGDEDKNTPDRSKTQKAFHEEVEVIRKWFDHHCLYLPQNIREGFVGVLNYSHAHIHDRFQARFEPPNRDVWTKLMDMTKIVESDMKAFAKKYNIVDRLLARNETDVKPM